MKILAYSIAIREALAEEMERDPRVFLLGEDIAEYGGCFGVTRGLVEQFGPERVRNTPISENSVLGVAVGAALQGMRPVFELMFMDFITLAMDQLVNHAAKFHYMYAGQVTVPLVIRTAAGGGRGYGATHSQMLDAWLLSVPGIKVIAPAFPSDAKGLLKAAIRDEGPVVFIEHKILYGYRGPVEDSMDVLPIGRARVVREGEDVTLISYSRMLHESLQAAEQLEQMGVSAEVIDLRTLFPLDEDALVRSVVKTRRAVLIEEGVSRWGVCAEIAARLHARCFNNLEAPIIRIGMPAIPIPCSLPLEARLLPNAHQVVQQTIEMLEYGCRLRQIA
jgi:pyruvate/2-oxoglutarate/acetoin dehydrogenase E1 component